VQPRGGAFAPLQPSLTLCHLFSGSRGFHWIKIVRTWESEATSVVKSESKKNCFVKVWGNKRVDGSLYISVYSLGIWSQNEKMRAC
jgi:hypothetical protein